MSETVGPKITRTETIVRGVSDIFIQRPVMTTLVMLGIVLFGVIGYSVLPVSDLPTIDYPTISVGASLPGANPETMAASVATPMERQFATIAGIDSISSTSSQGSTSITIQFDLSRDIDAAAQDVQTAISAVMGQLPPGMPTPPSLRKSNPSDSPILFIVMSSPTLPLRVVDEYAETTVAQQISMVSGVAQVQVMGAQKYAVRVRVDPAALATRQIGIDEVARVIRAGNPNLPVGTLYGPDKSLTIKADGQLTNAAAYASLVVAYRNGSPVRLSDVAQVLDSIENDKVSSTFNGNKNISLAVQKQPGVNIIQVCDAVKALLPQIRSQLPAAVSLDINIDRTQTIRQSFHDVQFTLSLAIALVVLVIFIFLRNVRATIIPSLSVPASLLFTFAVISLLGFSLNNLSLMAMTLSVGFVVDDAIVMLENIIRRLEHGDDVTTASFRGSREVGFTIVSMTVSLVAVFIPILFMGGILGRLFKEFAVTISVAVLASGLVSLTLTPMLCSKMLKIHQGTHGWWFRISEKAFDKLLAGYAFSLRAALKHSWVMGLTFIGTIWLTVHMFGVVPKGFIPTEDLGFLMGSTEAIQGITFEELSKKQAEAAAIVSRNENIATVQSSVGAGFRNTGGNTGSFFIRLKDRDKRTKSAEEVINELRPQLNRITGLRVFLQLPTSIRIGGMMSRAQYQVTLQGTDTARLFAEVPKLERKLRELPQLQDVNSDLQVRTPQMGIEIDRAQASTYGVTLQQIQSALNDSFGARPVTTIYTPTNEYNVIIEVSPERQRDPNILNSLYVRAKTGSLVPLSAVAHFREGLGPMSINHLGQLPASTISFNVKTGIALSEATRVVTETARGVLSPDTTLTFQGAAQAFEKSTGGLGWQLGIAVLVIYLVLGILYESFLHPLTILSGLPSAGLGALLTLQLFNSELNIYGFVGLLMLIGIVKKNAIMMIDFAIEAQRQGAVSARDAIYEACVVRFRPIMMTTLAALMGALPIALGLGAGADARRPLGLAVCGGLVFSQALTLYLTPVVYLGFEWLKGKLAPKPVVPVGQYEGS